MLITVVNEVETSIPEIYHISSMISPNVLELLQCLQQHR